MLFYIGGLWLGLMLRLGDTWEVGEFGASKGKGGCIVETNCYFIYQNVCVCIIYKCEYS